MADVIQKRAQKRSELNAKSFKEKGNRAFSAEEYDEAIEWYNKCLEEQHTTADAQLRQIVHSNLSVCYMKLKNFSRALESAEASILVAPSEKAFYRKATSLIHLGKDIEAKQTLEEGKTIKFV